MAQEAIEAVYSFRPYVKTDLNFIENSWAKSYFKGQSFNRKMSFADFNHLHRPIRDDILGSAAVAGIVCSATIDPDLIIGWMLIEQASPHTVVHYIYIKRAFKREGIATKFLSLLDKSAQVHATHLTERALKIIRANPKKYDFLIQTNEPILGDE